MKEFNENEELNINGNIAPGNNISEVDKKVPEFENIEEDGICKWIQI